MQSALTRTPLQHSEDRFPLFVEAVRDYAIFMLDPQGHVGTWNAGAQLLKGYRKEEIHRQAFFPVLPGG